MAHEGYYTYEGDHMYQFRSKVPITGRTFQYLLHSPPGLIMSSPAATQPPPLMHLKTSTMLYPKPRNGSSTWVVGGPGMRAVFLDSGQKKSFGTGVFLPRGSGTDLQSTKKPAFSPVLLPSRVVHALNLNVHELGLQIKPRDGYKKSKGMNREMSNKKEGSGEVMSQKPLCVISQNRTSSPEIFLPKEWTY